MLDAQLCPLLCPLHLLLIVSPSKAQTKNNNGNTQYPLGVGLAVSYMKTTPIYLSTRQHQRLEKYELLLIPINVRINCSLNKNMVLV